MESRNIWNRLSVLFLLAVWMALPACSGTTTITRDSFTYTAEQFAGLARETEAANALMHAAGAALAEGDIELCIQYATPALLIYEVAQVQAYRALWLAGLQYPNEDGSRPERGVEQPDPGPPEEGLSAEEFCTEE